MSHSFKSLLPSLLLIVIYFIADEFFGPTTGVWVALILGSIEFIYTRIREKIYDQMILWTTLFFCIPGLLMTVFHDSLVSRLQPVLIETALTLILGIFAFSQADPTATLPASYRKEMHLTPLQIKGMRHMLRSLFYLLCGHTLLAYGAIFLLPEATADFISTSLLYLLIGIYFITLFIRNRIIRFKNEKRRMVATCKRKRRSNRPGSTQHLPFRLKTITSGGPFAYHK